MSAALVDFTNFALTNVAMNAQWPVMARCVQALTAYYQAKISTGTEPADALNGLYLAVDGQSTTFKDWRIFVNSSNSFVVQENTGTDSVPVWVTRLELPLGGGFVSAHASTHQHGGTDEVATATPGANAIVKANGSGLLATGWLTGVIRNAEVSASAAIAYSKLNLATSIVNADISASAAIAYSKLNLATSIVNADISASAAIVYSKLSLTGGIVNADVNASAAIATTKLAAKTASRVAVYDSSGFLTDTGAATMPSALTMGSTIDMDGNQIFLTADQTGRIDGGGGALFRIMDSATNVFRYVSGGFFDFFFTDNGAGVGPQFRCFRVSASPAASDNLGVFDWYGNDSAGNTELYARLNGVIEDPTSTSEDARLDVYVDKAGTLTNVAQFNGAGVNLPIQTAGRAAIINANKDVASHSATTTAELGFVNGVTSAIQTQLNNRPVLLATYSPSTAASVDITSVFSGTYTCYFITFELSPATDDVEVYLRTDTSNGASFDSGASDYRYAMSYNADGGASGTRVSTGNTQIQIGNASAAGSVGNAAGEGVAGFLQVFTGSASRFPVINGHGGWFNASAGNLYRWELSAARNSAATINALQIFFETGNIASGTVKVYGMP